MKEKGKGNQPFRDKVFLVMLVTGLLTMVTAAGMATVKRGRGDEQKPYVDLQGQENFLAGESDARSRTPDADENRQKNTGEQDTDSLKKDASESREKQADTRTQENSDTVVAEKEAQRQDEQKNVRKDAWRDEQKNGQEFADAEQEQGTDDEAQEAGAGGAAAQSLILNFNEASRIAWPVRGNVLLDYSMDQTIYFPTLEQYRCSPGIVIQGSIGEPVYVPANAKVLEKGTNEEIGNYVSLDFGNGYQAVCGQLEEVSVVPGEYLEKGQLLGIVAEPTKYFSIEGSNVFFELTHDGEAIDPMGYLE